MKKTLSLVTARVASVDDGALRRLWRRNIMETMLLLPSWGRHQIAGGLQMVRQCARKWSALSSLGHHPRKHFSGGEGAKISRLRYSWLLSYSINSRMWKSLRIFMSPEPSLSVQLRKLTFYNIVKQQTYQMKLPSRSAVTDSTVKRQHCGIAVNSHTTQNGLKTDRLLNKGRIEGGS